MGLDLRTIATRKSSTARDAQRKKQSSETLP
ncbi:MAG: hypothetical protein ACI8T1_004935 [Verrucomicrobiales bacterium]